MRIALVLVACLAAEPLTAATFVVDSTTADADELPGDGLCRTAAGDCSLRAAIEESEALSGGDRIELPAGRYLDDLPEVRSQLEIVGSDRPELKAFTVRSGADLQLTGLDFTLLEEPLDPPAPPCSLKTPMIIETATVLATDCRFEGNLCPQLAYTVGESLQLLSGATLRLVNCVVENHDVYAIEANGAELIVEDSSFAGNAGCLAMSGGRLEAYRSSFAPTGDPLMSLAYTGFELSDAALIMEDVQLDSTIAPVIATQDCPVQISRTRLVGETRGDAALDFSGGDVLIEDLQVEGDRAFFAAIRANLDSFTARRLDFGPTGEPFSMHSQTLLVDATGPVVIEGLSLRGRVIDFPAIVQLHGRSVEVRDSVVHDSDARYHDVFDVSADDRALLSDSAFVDLQARQALVRVEAPTVELTNVSLVRSQADEHALSVESGRALLTGVTIARNSLGLAAIAAEPAADLLLDHVLIGENSGAPDCSGSVELAGPSLLEHPGGCDVLGDPSFLVVEAPHLMSLLHEGTSRASIAPSPASAAVDAGLVDCSALAGGAMAFDQRLGVRPQDGNADGDLACDLGAVETDPDGDDDGDGVANLIDNCPGTANPDQADGDGDGRGDLCQAPDEPSGFDGGPAPVPLTVGRLPNGDLRLTWEDVGTAVDHLVQGRIDELGPVLLLEAAACELTDDDATLEIAESASLYFLVVAEELGLLSSLGRDSLNQEREAASFPCP